MELTAKEQIVDFIANLDPNAGNLSLPASELYKLYTEMCQNKNTESLSFDAWMNAGLELVGLTDSVDSNSSDAT